MRTLKVTNYFGHYNGNPYYRLDLSGLRIGNADLAALLGQLTPEQKTQVRCLHLYNNYLTDLDAITGLVGLEYLYFDNNQVTDLSGIEGLESLKHLFFENNRVTDLSALESLTALELVVVTGNPIKDYSPLDKLLDCKVYR
jgi:Leucine-rich repeat (LRR) protein